MNIDNKHDILSTFMAVLGGIVLITVITGVLMVSSYFIWRSKSIKLQGCYDNYYSLIVAVMYTCIVIH